MKPINIILLLVFFTEPVTACYTVPQDSIHVIRSQTKWKAAWQTIGINTAIWGFNRFVLQEDFAKISLQSIGHNIKTGFVWDNDQFSTNLFAHPYHGSLYFNTARSNGMNFWQSAPYTLGGSLMWEIIAENEPPSINDLIATTFGGIALGEITYRMSSLVLDDSKQGFPRFVSEFLGTIISPIRGLNRLMNGDMWKVKRKHYKHHNYSEIPVTMEISSGNRYLANHSHLFKGEHNPYLELHTTYGDPFHHTLHKPYDYFTASITLGISPNQPLISNVNLIGLLWSTIWAETPKADVMYGIFQHFNYYDSEEVKDGSKLIPYKISEAASIGPGIICRFSNLFPNIHLQQEVYLSGILLGGGLTDYYHVIDRNYNLGSGYSIKNHSKFQLGRLADICLHTDLYHLFTWKGYDRKGVESGNPLYYNTQGDKGNTLFLVLNPTCDISLSKHWKATFEMAYYFRHTHYTHHSDIQSKTIETRLGITYQF